MNLSKNNFIWICTGFAVVAGLGILAGRSRTKTVSTTESTPSHPSSPAATVSSRTSANISAPPVQTGIVRSGKIQEACDALKAPGEPRLSRQRLADLREALAAMPKGGAVSAIRQFLDSKADAPTGLGFKVAANGLLDEAPSLRTFLLDQLERLDPAAAAEYARVILNGKDSPDEWALALRDLARGDAGGAARPFLEQKTGELLGYAPWQQNPSTGYLEAFDTAVYLGGTNLMQPLSELVRRQDNPAVAHAAFLSLDRLVINDPATTLTVLLAAPEMMQGRESTRADYFARADVRDPLQKAILESYLLNPQTSPAEANTFAAVFPNANFMISANLLTPVPAPIQDSLADRDAAALSVTRDWLADPRFERVQPTLTKMAARLEGFLRQAGR